MTETPIHVLWWDFFNPERLWVTALVPLLFIIYLFLLRLKRNKGMRYTQSGIVAAVLPRQSRWRRHISVLMTLLALITIVGAWARPVGEEMVPRERATVVLVMDRSLSMQATDIAPTRMEAAKEAAKRFVETLPETYNVSLVSMAGSSAVLVPPTTDRAVLGTMIDTMDMQEGTNMGDAIAAAVSAAAMAPGAEGAAPAPAMIVMLSDGQDNGQTITVQQACQRAVEAKIPIYTIAYGTQNGYVDVDGERFNVAPDQQMLAEIATLTGGQALDAASANQLDQVYKDVKSEIAYEPEHKEVTARWALIASAFAAVAALGAVSMAARWP